MSTQIPEAIEDVADEIEVEDTSFNDRNVEIHGRWVAAQEELEAAKKSGDARAETLSRNKMSRIGDEFVELNSGLAARVARMFFNPGSDSSKDYMQAARMGLWEAFLKWDSSRNTFGTFSRMYIRGATHRTVRQTEYNQLSQTDFNMRSKVQVAQRKLALELDRAPSYQEIAEATGFSVLVVERTMSQKAVSLDTPVGDGESTLGDLVSETEAPSSLTEAEAQQLEKLFDELNETEVWVMAQRNGLAGGPPQSLVEVADGIGIGREIARRTEKKAIEKLAEAARRRKH